MLAILERVGGLGVGAHKAEFYRLRRFGDPFL